MPDTSSASLRRQYTVSGNDYRYGFNGKEGDDEVKGDDNQQDYGMRIYDPRIGRFLSVDPIARDYPMLSSYQFAGNGPIKNIDLDGLEPWGNPKDWQVMKDWGDHYNIGRTLLRVYDNDQAEYYWVLTGQHGKTESFSWYDKKTEQYESFVPAGYVEASDGGSPMLPTSDQPQWDNNVFRNYSGLKKNADQIGTAVIGSASLLLGGGVGMFATRGLTWAGAGAGAADFTTQMIDKKDIFKWNITSTGANIFMRNPSGVAFVGSAGEIQLGDLLNLKLFKNTIFGSKDYETIGRETAVGSIANFAANGLANGAISGSNLGAGFGQAFMNHMTNTITGIPATAVNESLKDRP